MSSMSFDELAAAVWAAGALAGALGFALLLIRGQLPAQVKAVFRRSPVMGILVLIVGLTAWLAWPIMIPLLLWKRHQSSRA